ncbi:MAG: asparagine synthase (glutamine-hydrolyzing) [Coriobacteriales bacterium]|jgi:asparagine synthase (glutamine-hydrolysing)|nr:asparagine synthase (glutamine-hydrolyzing) [Coriobacteriales bacterium]
MSGFVGIAGTPLDLGSNKESVKEVGRSKEGNNPNLGVLVSMMDRIVHRGPDAAGIYADEQVALGFRRLSIIDLSENAEQPMSNSLEDDTVVMVCDGAFNNHLELRAALEQAGHRFASKNDAEVLLHGYQQWGSDVVQRLRGTFAFVIYDRTKNILFGARDFFGAKPFYYTRLANGNLLFGSEIKSFLEHPSFKKELNKEALKPYLTFQYSVLEETFFKGVFKLLQAHCFTFDLKTQEMNIQRYWDADFSQALPPSPNADRSFDECVDALDGLVRKSVEANRNADVKVGAFLSGGVDSSYVVSALKPQKTFSVGSDVEGFDETVQARELSEMLGIENHRRCLDPNECFEAFSDIQYHLDEPASNPSVLPLYFLSQLAHEHVGVVLSGEGSDEFFAGYAEYKDTRPVKKYKRVVPSVLRRGLSTLVGPLPHIKGRAFFRRGSGRAEDYFIGQAFIFDENEARAVLKPSYRKAPSVKEITAPIYKRVAHLDELSKKQYLDLNLWMPSDICLKADKMTMAHSLEMRSPLLDMSLFEEAQRTPVAHRITAENDKMVLRTAAARTIPAAWADRVKLGFPTPIRAWLKQERFSQRIRELFASEMAAEFFDTKKLLALLDGYNKGIDSNGRKIWTAYTFLVWYERYFVEEANLAEEVI